MGKGMMHFTEDGEYKGETHKMNGKIHTGAEHSETSEVVSHNKKGPFAMKGYTYPGTSPIEKKVSWKYGKGTYSGELIPSKETSTHRYARTHNGKIKSLPK